MNEVDNNEITWHHKLAYYIFSKLHSSKILDGSKGFMKFLTIISSWRINPLRRYI